MKKYSESLWDHDGATVLSHSRAGIGEWEGQGAAFDLTGGPLDSILSIEVRLQQINDIADAVAAWKFLCLVLKQALDSAAG